MAGESSYVERAPAPALAPLAWSVWIQQVGDRPLAQRHESRDACGCGHDHAASYVPMLGQDGRSVQARRPAPALTSRS